MQRGKSKLIEACQSWKQGADEIPNSLKGNFSPLYGGQDAQDSQDDMVAS